MIGVLPDKTGGSGTKIDACGTKFGGFKDKIGGFWAKIWDLGSKHGVLETILGALGP